MEIEIIKEKYLRLISFFVITVGMIAILGWIFNVSVLKSFYPGLPPMRFNAALVLISLGISFYCLITEKRKYLLRILCSLIIVYGIASIYQDIAKVNFGLDNFFVKDVGALSMSYSPGRPPIMASTSFILMAAAFFIHSVGKENIILIAQYLLHFITFFSFFVILGYILNFPSYYKIYSFSSPALNLAISLFMLSIGAALLRKKGITSLFIGYKSGNVQARRLFPRVMAFLLLITYLRVLTYKNEWITEETGIAFIIILFAIAALIIIWYNTKELNLLEDKKRTAFENLQKNKEEYVANIEQINKDLSDYKLALDAANYVTITDQNGNIQKVNDNFCRFSKYSSEELIGKNHRVINSGYHSREFFQNLWQTITAGKIWQGEVRNKAKDGTFFWSNTTIVPFVDRSGTPYKYVAIRSNITERIQTHQMLEEKIKELEGLNKELETFTFISSHDLQEPLRKVKNFTIVLLEEERKNLSESGKYYLERMEETTTRMRKLIEDLLTYSRAKNSERKFEKTNLTQIAKEVIAEFEEAIQEKKAVVKADGLCEAPIIRFQFRQLLHNLISNALKFSHPERPPLIIIKSETGPGKKFDNNQLSPEINYCHIVFSDNGIGFDPQYADKIFVVCQRLHEYNEYKGTGIGLAICKRIVENHQGIITSIGKPGEGAQFDIYIPSQVPN